MMLGPILSPVISGAISLTLGDRSLLGNSFRTSLLAIPIAVSVAVISVIPFSTSVNSTMNMIISAGLENIILSIFVGSAATLAFVTGMRDQIAGVAEWQLHWSLLLQRPVLD